jgi:hypothetical protein
MRMKIGVAALALALAGCAGATTEQGGDGSLVGVVGTPFLLIGKVPACLVTALVAGPGAAASEFDRPDPAMDALRPDEGAQIRRDLDDALVWNCGPPYVVKR